MRLSANNIRFLFIAFSAAMTCLLNTTPAKAAVTPSRSEITVPHGGSATVTILWTISDTVSLGNVTSSGGQFEIPGPRAAPPTVLGTVPTTFAQSTTASTIRFTEMLIVPHNVVARAIQLNTTTFVYRRDFVVNGQTQSGQPVNVTVVSGSAGSFAISRLALSFDNGTAVRVLERKQALRANAEINFNGNGMIQAVWEVADPASTSGDPVFRPLTNVHQYLIGSDAQTIRSPTLPTDNVGLHLLRLRITDPAPGFEPPVIRYFVTDKQDRAQLPPAPIGLVTPPNQSLLAPEMTFAWEPIPGARAYQLELYLKPRVAGDTLPDLGGAVSTAPQTLPQTFPVTGMLVPGEKTRTALSDSARTHLQSGQRYLWRVLAIGSDGNISGESSIREIELP